MLMRMWNNRCSSSLLVEMQNGTVISDNGLGVSYKIKQTTIKLYDYQPRKPKALIRVG